MKGKIKGGLYLVQYFLQSERGFSFIYIILEYKDIYCQIEKKSTINLWSWSAKNKKVWDF